jgi:quercetin dioxygenase-like cupin family protein
MDIIDHEREPLDQWRDGVMTRMRVSALNGAGQLCLFEQFCEPGTGAPTHTHTVEEVLTVLSGEAEIWVGDERGILAQGQSMIVSPGQRHGFRNVGRTTLHVHATLAAPIFEASFEGQAEVRRRWVSR